MEYNRVILSNFIAMATVDGNVDDKEKQTLYKLGEKYGFSKSLIDEEILANSLPQFDEPYIVSISNDSSRIYDIIRMAISNGELHKKEEELLYKLLKPYGYSTSEVKELIDIAKYELLKQQKIAV